MGGPTGAIRLLAVDRDMTGAEFAFRENSVIYPWESAVSLQGPKRISGVHFDGLTTSEAARTVDVRPGTRGEAAFSGVTGTATHEPSYRNPDPGAFKLQH